MLILYLYSKATNSKYNSCLPRKLARSETIWQMLDNLKVIPMSSCCEIANTSSALTIFRKKLNRDKLCLVNLPYFKR